MPDELRATPLLDRHEALGARLGAFAGWRMPIRFAGTIEEHRAVREDVGVFDVSHLGTVWVRGQGAEDAVAATLTNDPARLADGACQYTLCCRDDGGIIDDLIVCRLASNRFLAVPNAANTARVATSLERSAGSHGAEVDDASGSYAVLAIQGPRSLDLVGDALGVDAAGPAYMELRDVELEGEASLISRTGYTGERGCELVIPVGIVATVWDEVVDAGATPCGLAARDTLRLEMGYPLHGNDLSVGVSPYEARLGWAVALDRGGFRGQESLRALKQDPPARLLRGLRGAGRRPPRPGMAVRTRGGRAVGEITSGSFSPTLGVGIGLAYLERGVEPGEEVVVDVRGTDLAVTVVDPPFVDRSPRG